MMESGPAPSVEKPVGPYPTLVTQHSSGRVVPVVQAYAHTKYLGRLKLWLDDEGEMIRWEGKPILLDASIEKGKWQTLDIKAVHLYSLPFAVITDESVLEELKPWKKQIEVLGR